MNDEPKKAPSTDKEKIEQACSLISQAMDLVGEVQDNQKAIYEDKPEGWQESEKGQELQDTINVLEEEYAALDSAKTELEGLNI